MNSVESRNYAEPKEIIAVVTIHGSQRGLTRQFFSTNTSDPAVFCKCGKGPLGKHERVDTEFWPGTGSSVIETYCLDCWANK